MMPWTSHSTLNVFHSFRVIYTNIIIQIGTDPSASLHYQLLSYRLNNQTSSSLIKRFELFEIQQKVKSPIKLCTEVCESINPRTLTVSRSSLINDYLQPYCMSFDPYNEFLLAGIYSFHYFKHRWFWKIRWIHFCV